MCGIVGEFSLKHFSGSNWVESGVQLLNHRGPDSGGTWESDDRFVKFGHSRLSIIDLSESGKQPLVRSDLGFVIVFNGELYNYKTLRNELEHHGYTFETLTDTEVVLLAYVHWREKCITKLEGMFAFAIYNINDKDLFMARDISGEKPLYYFLHESSLYFSSELKPFYHINDFDVEVEKSSIYELFAHGFIADNRSICSKVKKLPSAHYLKYSHKGIVVTRYWSLPKYEPSTASIYDLVNKLDAKLCASVKSMLVADVNVGVLLSGGLDSSLVTAIASKVSNKKISTFNVSFINYPGFDESKYATEIANYFNTNHKTLNADSNLLIKFLPKMPIYYDEPIIDSSMLPTLLVSSLVSRHCKVALGGDGADELFGGYYHYKRLAVIERFAQFIPLTFRKLLSKSLIRLLPGHLKIRRYIPFLGINFKKYFPRVVTYFSDSELQKLFSHQMNSDFKCKPLLTKNNDDINIVDSATRFDFENFLAQDILVKVDRASMAHSLELRSPFLSKDLIEFSFRDIHPNFKATPNSKKIILKILADKYLPKNFDINRKQGFSIPIDTWFREGELLDYFNLVVLKAKKSPFSLHYIHKLLSSHQSGVDSGEKLFAILQMQLWYNTYIVSDKDS